MANNKENKMQFRKLLLIIFLTFYFANNSFSEDAKSVSFRNHIGWLHGNCLSIDNPNLKIDSSVIVVEFSDPKKIVNAKIVRRAVSADTCHALLNERRAVNAQKNSFYILSISNSMKFGIGLVQSKNEKLKPSFKVFDIDQDGVDDEFYYCFTSEGIQFSIWKREPYKSKRLWNDYYYLGYDLKATCPE